MNKTNQREQLWASKEFVAMLKKIQGAMMVNGKETTLVKLTEEISKCPSFGKVMEELFGDEKSENLEINIKIDKKKLWA